MNFDFLKPQLKVQGHKLVIYNKIGEGAFAYVYKVKLLSNTSDSFRGKLQGSFAKNTSPFYAVKKMICQTEEHIELASKEMRVMLEIQHTNVIPLLGNPFISNIFHLQFYLLTY